MALSAVCFSLMGVCVKLLVGIPAVEIVFWRGLLCALITLGIGAVASTRSFTAPPASQPRNLIPPRER